MHPTEPSKPQVPYAHAWKFAVHQHVPPDPTPVTYNCCLSNKFEMEERRLLPPAERCLRHSPLPGKIVSSVVQLEILDLIRVGDGCNAQVFTVKILGTGFNNGRNKELVAKVYDPLYFDDEGGLIDPFRCVDKHYTHEVRAYNMLSELQGGLIPKFYGSYSFDISVHGSGNRAVRLILIEYIPALSMQQVNPGDFSQYTRKHIMKSVVDFESLVYERDILLTDLSPRNVIMLKSPSRDGERSLVFLDFAGALFGRRRDDPVAIESNLFLGQYISPLLRWDKSMAMEFNDWIDWEWRPWVEAEYAHTAGSITLEMREVYL